MTPKRRAVSKPRPIDDEPSEEGEELLPPVAGCVCPTCELARAQALADREKTWAPRPRSVMDFSPFNIHP